jgi:hypothetical protein
MTNQSEVFSSKTIALTLHFLLDSTQEKNGGFSYVYEEIEEQCVAKVRLAIFIEYGNVIAFVCFLTQHQTLNSYYLPYR